VKLRGKTLLIVAATTACLLAILYSVSRHVLLSGFSKVEYEYTVKNVERMLDAFTENSNNLSIKNADWAKWDDTYRFIKDRNGAFLQSNLQDQTLADLKINCMFFIDTAGAVVFRRGYDAVSQKWFAPSPAFTARVLADSLLVRHPNTGSVVAGIMLSPDGPITVASRPIITSEGKGPIRGSVVFTRKIDHEEIARLAQLTHLSITAENCGDSLSPGMAAAARTISDATPVAVRALGRDSVAGYCAVNDIHGKPALLCRVAIDRAIYRQGRLSTMYLVIAIVLVGIIFGTMILVLLEKSVISRVAKLSRDIKAVGARGDHANRVALGGNDELADLAGSMNSMLASLEKSENVIREHNRQMRIIMNTVPSGLLSLDENFAVSPGYTRSIETILKRDNLAGRNFFDVVGLTHDREDDRRQLADFLTLLRQEALPEKEMAGLNPFEELKLPTDDIKNARWLRLRYFLIERDAVSASRHILVTMEDITEEKALAEMVRQSERENLQLKAMVEDPELFKDFLNETCRLIRHAGENAAALTTAGNGNGIVNSLFRDVHTIKGTASSFGLSTAAEIAGAIESTLGPLRDNGALRPELKSRITASLEELSGAVMEAVDRARGFLGEDGGDDNDITLKISLAKLKNACVSLHDLIGRAFLDPATADIFRAEIEQRLRTFRLVPARKGFAKALRIVPGLIARLQKNIAFHLEGDEVAVDCETARELNTPLIHLIRNAFDHGIESSGTERTANGKPLEGRVTLNVRTADHTLTVAITDDGRGIDPEKIKLASLRRGLFSENELNTMSKEKLLSLIYRPGFSTADAVSDVSGRGVGMDAVMESVKERLHGAIAVDSETGRGTTFTLSIPVK
jgi:sensor domain CHASE-containing protein/HPt (histidine-containing phosphotransfer) domain-containing protein